MTTLTTTDTILPPVRQHVAFTPGPWQIIKHPDPKCCAVAIGDASAASYAAGFATVWSADRNDNAALIAAAPALYEALKDMMYAAAMAHALGANKNANLRKEAETVHIAAREKAAAALSLARGELGR